MDKLERFILDNKNEFDSQDPAPELWDGVRQRLEPRRTNYRSLLWKAAAAILIFGAGWSVNHLTNRNSPEPPVAETQALNPDITELVEAEAYYTSIIEVRRKEVEIYLEEHPELLIELKAELDDLDEEYAILKNELGAELAQRQIIEAMIQNHRIKMEILNEVLVQIKPETSGDENSRTL